MAVISLTERLDGLTRAALEEVAKPEDDVAYAVAMADHYTECEHGDMISEPAGSLTRWLP